LKAQLVTKGYTQTYGVHCFQTFSVIARLHSVKVPLSIVVVKHLPLYQLDIKNAFLHVLPEEFYIL